MGFIIQAVFSGTSFIADVEIIIGQVQSAFANLRQSLTVAIERGVETGFKHLLGLRRRRPELQNLEGPELGHQLEEERQKTLARTGFAIILSPLAFVICTR